MTAYSIGKLISWLLMIASVVLTIGLMVSCVSLSVILVNLASV